MSKKKTNNINLTNNNPVKRNFVKTTMSQRMADRASRIIGSWSFIIIQTLFVLGWIGINIFMFVEGWDPYPFIFLNLMLSVIATYSAPIILMSQNREAERDRLRAINDLATDRKALRETGQIRQQLVVIGKKIDKFGN